MNERKLTKSELAKREDIIMKMKKNKRALTQKYGKDAEAVMYGRATKLAKKQAEAMDQDKIRELVKDALQNPKKADLNKDGKLSDYEKKRGAAIEKAMSVDEVDNSEYAMAVRASKAYKPGPKPSPKRHPKPKDASDLRKLDALEKRRAQIMRDMEQEAEMEGGPIADKYGDMLNTVDAEIAKEKAMMGLEEEFDLDVKGGTEPDKDADVAGILGAEDVLGLEEGASTEEKRIAMRAIKSIAKYRGVSNDEARNDLVRAAKEIGDLKEDLDLGHQDNEPHMLKADLYRIGKYAMELYQMVDKFEAGSEEVDFPHWWQSKVIKAKDMLVSAKHYLDFEIKEPQIDAMVDVAQDVEAIDEAVGKFVVRPCSAKDTPFAVWQTSKDGENDKRIKGFKTKEDAKKFADEKNSVKENALGMTDSRLSSDQHVELDYAVRGDSAYTFGNDPYADDQLRYKYAKKMGFLEEKKDLKEGTWSLGSANEIKDAIHTLEMWYDLDAREISALFDDRDNSRFFYNVVGDDLFHDALDRAEREAAADNTDRAHNAVTDAIGRAEELLAFVQKREGVKEGLPKGYWDKKMDAKDEVSEDYDALVNKIKKQGKSEKAAKAIAGAVASYKAKGGGKGPTAKQKARG